MAEADKKPGRERKNQEFHMRITREEMAALEWISYETGKSKSDVMRRALITYGSLNGYNKNKQEDA